MERMKYYRGIKICPKCKGEGVILHDEREMKEQGVPERELCPRCRGSGRVKYYTEVKIVEEPYEGLYTNIGD